MQLIECVPNFSEGQKSDTINAIAEAIKQTSGVHLLDVDIGSSANRTVMSFVGEPEAVLNGAFAGIAKAAQLIDMRVHKGIHPRIGATDVCPFVPVLNVDIKECVKLAERLGKRVADDLGIPIYLYGAAAKLAERVRLANIRIGGYEGLEKRIESGFLPDFGSPFNSKSGATVIGARPFLIAYNLNLDTKDQGIAQEIALSIRESGRLKRNQDRAIERDPSGKPIVIPGSLKSISAVGWFAKEFDRAQVSTNVTDLDLVGLHHVFMEVSNAAKQLGTKVTGSEIVGLVPLKAILSAGRYFAGEEKAFALTNSDLIAIAVDKLGLDELKPFASEHKILEYRIALVDNRFRKVFQD
jgi:glutamate formiminotransferase/formiminotetrahydrofolate cyclodeaminase